MAVGGDFHNGLLLIYYQRDLGWLSDQQPPFSPYVNTASLNLKLTRIKKNTIQHQMACFFNYFVLYDFSNKLVENVVHDCYRLGSNKFLQGQIIRHCEVA